MNGHVGNELHMLKVVHGLYRVVAIVGCVPSYWKRIKVTYCVFSRGFDLMAAAFAYPFEVEITQIGNFAFFV